MKIDWKLFDGIQPRMRPHLLGEAGAQRALNAKLWSGAAEPFQLPLFVKNLPRAGTKLALYRHGQSRTDDNYWFDFTTDVDVARGLVADDTLERVYWTGDGAPKMTDATVAWTGEPYPSGYFLLGLPAPSAATISSPGSSGTPVKIALVYIYVTASGETGPPSPASNLIDYYAGQTLTVTGLQGVPSGAYNLSTGKKYLYLASTDSNGTTAYRFWKEVGIGVDSTSGVPDFTLLGEALATPSLIAPPSDLFGLMTHPGGFMTGFSGRRFCRSEIFKPYGWPTLYRDPLPDDPVGGAVLGMSTVVCTKGVTVLFTGADPLNQMKQDLEGWQPCVSKRSIKRTTAGVIYASADGLVLVNGAGPLVVVTSNHFRRDQWQKFRPESSHAAVHDDRYYWWWDNGTERGLLVFEFGGGGVQQVVESDIYATTAFADHRKDELYIALPSDNNLYRWDSGPSASVMTWRSKLFHIDRPQCIGAVRVDAAAYPVTFRLIVGGTAVHTKTVTSGEPTTLRGDRRYREFAIEVEGSSLIDAVSVASTIAELRQ